MNKYKFPKSIIDIFSKFNEYYKKEKVEYVAGLYGSTFSIFADYVYKINKQQILIITPDMENARNIYDDLLFLHDEKSTVIFPLLEIMSTESVLFHPSLLSEFQNVLIKMAEGDVKIIILPLETSFIKVLNKNELNNEYFSFSIGDEIDRDTMVEFLIDYGYTRVDAVEILGDISIRGSLVDIFPYDSSDPIRIEFFGNEITSIRKFEIISQRSIENLQSCKFSSQIFDSNKKIPNASIFDYLDENATILFNNSELIQSKLNKWKNILLEKKKVLNTQVSCSDIEEFEERVTAFKTISQTISSKKTKIFNFPYHPQYNFQGSLKLLFNSLKEWKTKNGNLKKYFIYCEDSKKKENLLNFLIEELGEDFIPRIITAPLSNGFSFNNNEYMFLTEHEIFKRVKTDKTNKKLHTSGSIIRKMKQLSYGDIVVHQDYGVGEYFGIEQLSIADNPPKDVVKLIYKDEDILYVSLDKINKIQKYSSMKENLIPQLSKIGSAEWNSKKKKTKKAVEKIASDLIQLYAARMSKGGFKFSEDTLWQKEMETSFAFEATPDQNKAIEEVKMDMQKPQSMDRLLCGDVGFGKTEVAIRAAFKAVQDDKQVAVLAPTTLLTHQHLHTFKNRLVNFPVNIEAISRFRTRKEQSEIISRIEKGKIDIIIGTHRLFSGDINFKSLGLLIVDEEQRFGVSHKEKIKKLKTTVDVLSMSATPIPRTLHMALMGARDLSQIETPPKNRLPVYTEITNWDDSLLQKVITRETNRDGQVFFVHNRVETIFAVKKSLEQLMPNIKFAVAHGQMVEKQLETIMKEFYNKKYDVLVSTMIIENGIDIPQCNTILINQAHKFGLSQLYQLRGRVGRSERQAYAYLIVPNLKKLSQEAIKRLYAIQEYTELGSGLKVAMKDLEIRGSGNLLGHQQSGHINAIGYDLYVKLLKETMDKIKDSYSESIKLPQNQTLIETSVDIKAEVFFPDEYICSKSEKAFLYYRLGQLTSRNELKDFEEELKDRFGEIPQSALNLLFLHYLRIFGGKNYIQRFVLSSNKLLVVFHKMFLEQKTKFDELIQKIHTFKEYKVQFKQADSLQLHVTILNGNLIENNFILTKKLLQEII